MKQSAMKKRKKNRWRWLIQFRLRTMLILMAIIAAMCGWYLKPEQREWPLVGGVMKILERFRTEDTDN